MAGGLIAFGALTIFSLVGIPFLLAGLTLAFLAWRMVAPPGRVIAAATALLGAAITATFLLYGGEHIWAQPSCTQHANQVSGSIQYWSGAKVQWRCDNGQPIILRDTR
jgi:hypothetical protein